MRELLFVFGWLGIIGLKILIDWYQRMKLKRVVMHGLEFVIVCILCVTWMYYAGGAEFRRDNQAYALELWAFQFGSYGLLFNGLYNLACGENWWTLGKTSVFDRFFKPRMAAYFMYHVFCAILMGFGIKFIFEDLKYFI